MLTDAKPPFEARAMLDRLYAGEILCFSALPAMQALVALARDHCERALAGIAGDPTQVHAVLAPAEQVEHLGRLRRDYAQDGAVRARWRELFESIGLPAEQVARDRLLLRFQTHHLDDATRAGNIHTDPLDLHRDTWGSNLYAQINWWAPVYPLDAGRTMAIYPALWDRPLQNSTAGFELPRVVQRNRQAGGQGISVDEVIPHPLEPVDPALAVPVIIEPGQIIAFSGAHLHASIPNATGRTRISVDTRSVSIEDTRAGRGARNVDGHSRWMAPGWFRRVSDGKRLSELLDLEPLCPFAGQPEGSSARGQGQGQEIVSR